MKTAIPLRIASALTAGFCVGHTYAALRSPLRNPAEAAVSTAMQSYKLKLLAVLLWQLSTTGLPQTRFANLALYMHLHLHSLA